MIIEWILTLTNLLLITIVLQIFHYGSRPKRMRKTPLKRPTSVRDSVKQSSPKYRARAPSEGELYDREKFGD